MKIGIILFIVYLTNTNFYCQERKYSFDLFTVQFNGSHLKTFMNDKLVFQKDFNDPHEFVSDLDNDGVNELLVTDSFKKGNGIFYTLYIFNTIDSFYTADSIYSGALEPYQINSDEVGGTIIITGNSKFDIFNKEDGEAFIPIECWKYESSQLYPINDEVYDIFISENENLIETIDSYLETSTVDCKSIDKLKAIIASVYTNYISAGEKILASKFIKKYYPCSDAAAFIKTINELK